MPLGARAFDFCHGCYALKSTTAPSLWIGPNLRGEDIGLPTELIWVENGANHAIFYHFFQGTFGMPGQPPAFYLMDAQSEAIDREAGRRASGSEMLVLSDGASAPQLSNATPLTVIGSGTKP